VTVSFIEETGVHGEIHCGPSWIYDWHKYHNLGRNRKTMITNVLLGYNFISCVGEIQLKCETITYNDKYNVMNTG
jgi:hypothetical protein